MQTSNAGFSPRELQRRQFQEVAALTIDRHASAIGQLVEAINHANVVAKMSREFAADLSVRIDAHDAVLRRGFLGRLRWLLTGK